MLQRILSNWLYVAATNVIARAVDVGKNHFLVQVFSVMVVLKTFVQVHVDVVLPMTARILSMAILSLCLGFALKK